ncbi:uncharacterized protein LOC129601857 [Paramacrobiotus metropolitanus]|uniref:uncharacterized protein LOC129601857 n=1 Tax=Paramacrobiotus metropolitanus TaxID=2943436 RepID=UPI002445CB28|nr:uncharacterized protein LOC129601857 [Paramacrobiotus metropolitanus]XP_055356748.1 uncharacterized protein LOC129601857 [Paramacrobiotus metropolitanus]
MESLYNARNPAVKRLFREAQELRQNPDEDFNAEPLKDNLFEWHFTIRGPSDTSFENGLYHGRIILPPDYPMKPPNIIILTPNGRFETNTKICLSISGYHPETWQPSWSIRTALKALIGFMPTPGNGAIGSLDLPDSHRRQLAIASRNWKCPECQTANCDLLVSCSTSGNTSTPTPTPTDTVDGFNPFSVLAPRADTSASAESLTPSITSEPVKASGDIVDDPSFAPLARPRASSLQSRPGQGSGKRAHFATELVKSTTFNSSDPPSEAYVFPPRSPLAQSTSEPVVAQSSASFLEATTPSSPPRAVQSDLTEMRERQAKILQERRRVLRERLATTEREPETGEQPSAAGAFGVTDPQRLERIVQGLRQIVLFIMVCLMIIILRRVMMVLEDDSFAEL